MPGKETNREKFSTDRRGFTKLLASSVCVSGVGAGCLEGTSDPNSNSSSGKQGSAGNKSNKNKSSNVLLKYPGYFAPDVEDLVQDFSKKNSLGIQTSQTPGTSSQTYQYYANVLERKPNAFDVGFMDVIWPAEFVENGWVAEVEDPMNHTDSMLESSVNAVTINDKLYGMPMVSDAQGLFYRKDLLEEYGYDPPKTYSELVDIASSIISDDKKDWNGYIWQGGTNEGLTIMWLEWLWGFGGKVVYGDGDDMEIRVNTAEGLDALNHSHDLVYEHGVTPKSVVRTSTDTEDNLRTFQEGNTLFMRMWPYAIDQMNQEGSPVKDKFDVVPLPTSKNNKGASNSCLGGWNLFINAGTDKKEDAQKLLNYVGSIEAQEILALQHSRLPARKELYQEKYMDKFELLDTYEGILSRTNTRPSTPKYSRFSEIIYTQVSRALRNKKGNKKALEDAQEKIDEEINTG